MIQRRRRKIEDRCIFPKVSFIYDVVQEWGEGGFCRILISFVFLVKVFFCDKGEEGSYFFVFRLPYVNES